MKFLSVPCWNISRWFSLSFLSISATLLVFPRRGVADRPRLQETGPLRCRENLATVFTFLSLSLCFLFSRFCSLDCSFNTLFHRSTESEVEPCFVTRNCFAKVFGGYVANFSSIFRFSCLLATCQGKSKYRVLSSLAFFYTSFRTTKLCRRNRMFLFFR